LVINFGGFIKGIISKIESKDYYVFGPGKLIRCNLRGKFQKEFNLKKDKLYNLDIAVVGDEVEIEMNKDNTGTIVKVSERKNYISRKALKIKGGGQRGERLEQVIASNVDSVFVVASTVSPSFNSRFIDRLVVAGESSDMKINIIINKTDLGIDDDVKYFAKLYSDLGYKVFKTSVPERRNIEELRKELERNVNLFFGPSGVGKSSLLNELYPGLNFRVGDVSSSTSKGKHTTVTSVMNKVAEDTYIIDTPGVREFDPYGVKEEDLGHYFPEIAAVADRCKFNTCTHNHEPGCAVREAVEDESISPARYESYLNILRTIEDGLFF
jgi:ribosome biogenesis GTPase / thiamine phosphate phosphatase